MLEPPQLRHRGESRDPVLRWPVDPGIRGDDVCDVQLPVWARNDPIEFIKRNREALESQIVSENLHNWIDLIFGWKQRGIPAEESMNVFIHLTYDGEVDVDAISDPILRDATIAQINNFGQTPTKLFDKPHPKKTVYNRSYIPALFIFALSVTLLLSVTRTCSCIVIM